MQMNKFSWMQWVFNFREKVRQFADQHNMILRIMGKFLWSLLMIMTVNSLFGYADILKRVPIAIGASIICMFIPFSCSIIVLGVICALQLAYVSVDVMLVFVIGLLLFYFIYNRVFREYGYIMVLTLMLLPTPLSGAVPIFVGMFSGGLGIPPMLMGIFTYFFASGVKQGNIEIAKNLDSQQLYQLVLDSMLQNHKLILFLLCFTITALIAGRLYRMKMNYAWHIAIIVSGAINTVIYLYGCFLMEVQSPIATSILAFLLSTVILEVIQFFRCIVDYSQEENLEFEDDDYYYYVKAIPKIKVAKKDKKIKHISIRKGWSTRKEKKG